MGNPNLSLSDGLFGLPAKNTGQRPPAPIIEPIVGGLNIRPQNGKIHLLKHHGQISKRNLYLPRSLHNLSLTPNYSKLRGGK